MARVHCPGAVGTEGEVVWLLAQLGNIKHPLPVSPWVGRRGSRHQPSWDAGPEAASRPSQEVGLHCIPVNPEKARPWAWGGRGTSPPLPGPRPSRTAAEWTAGPGPSDTFTDKKSLTGVTGTELGVNLTEECTHSQALAQEQAIQAQKQLFYI